MTIQRYACFLGLAVGFRRFLNRVPTVSRKAYLAYRTGVSSLHILGSTCKNVDMLPVITHEQNMRLDL